MGTLTGGAPSLPEQCLHKLATSCRLTATPKCCACLDQRPHASTYSTYVDGVGLVMRGTRWQRYCWFCKEYWQNRLSCTHPPVPASQTRIPEIPSQTEFLERWHEYHRGYRLVKENGQELKIEVPLPQPWRDVAPGHLPSSSVQRVVGRHSRQTQRQSLRPRPAPASNVSLEATIDSLINDARAEEAVAVNDANHLAESSLRNGGPGDPSANFVEPSTRRANPARRLTQMQRELQRLNNGIARLDSGFRELGIDCYSNTNQANSQIAALNRMLSTFSANQGLQRALTAPRPEHPTLPPTYGATINESFQQAARRLAGAQRSRNEAAMELEAAENELQLCRERHRQMQREQRSAQNFARVFGSREEIERQGSEYVSPISGLFTRAYERYSVAEEVRREERASMENASRHRHLIEQINAVSHMASGPAQLTHRLHSSEVQPQEDVEAETADAGVRSLDDANDERPPPKSAEEMTVKLTCRICLSQVADTAVFPCGHLLMCEWCANIQVPVRDNDRTQPLRRTNCPLCRKTVRHRFKVFTAA